MTFNGWIQIAIYCAIVVALVKPLGGYMTRVFNGERTFLSPVLRPVEAALYRARRRRRDARAALADLRRRHAALQRRRLPDPLRACCACKAVLPFNPQGMAAVPGSLLQHGRQLRHQHQLAELRRREHDVLSRADVGPDAAEFPLGGDRHRARGRADPRLRARLGEDHRQFLGRYDPLHALHPAADLHRLSPCSSSGRACRRRSAPMSTRRRWKAPSRRSPSGPVASQVAIKMLGTNGGGFFNANSAHPFENPTALIELAPDRLDLRDRRGADQCVRPHGRRPAPGLGDLRRHGRRCSSPASPSAYWAEAAGNPQFARARARPAATWKARRSASASPCRRCSRSSRRPPPAARSTPCTIASRRSAA